MNDYRAVTQKQIDEYWEPSEDSDPRVPWKAVVSRNVVQALEYAEGETNISLTLAKSSQDDGQAMINIVWASISHPSGRDVYCGEIDLETAVMDYLSDHSDPRGNSDTTEFSDLANEFERLAKLIRSRIA